MKKAELIAAINAAFPGLNLPEDTIYTVDVLKTIYQTIEKAGSATELASKLTLSEEKNASLIKSLEELSASLEESEKKVPEKGKVTVKVKNTTYLIRGGVRNKGAILTPAEIAKNPELLEKLIEVKSPLLQILK
jgi:Asp-tRNA(Asn)/Glu-tRNA(Gln) amidotransferase C subunit